MATIVIKKYGNRRLYDTSDSAYVTLDELAVKIRGGVDIRVVDAQNNDDLTQATLAQIVLETGHASKFLPVQLLTQMIRLSDDSLAEFFSRYVTGALDLYLQAKRGAQTLAAYNPLTQLPMAATDALTRMWMGTPFGGYQQPYQPQGYAPPSAYVAPPPPDEPEAEPRKRAESEPSRKRADTEPVADQRTDDVAAMRRELDELKQAIREGLSPKRKKRKP